MTEKQELSVTLNQLNLKLTDVQKLVVGTLNALTKQKFPVGSPAAEHVTRLFEEANADLTATESHLKTALLATHQPEPEAPVGSNQPIFDGGPQRTKAAQPASQVRRTAGPEATQKSLTELGELTRTLAANALTKTVTARHGEEAGQAVAAKLAPQFHQSEEPGPTLTKREVELVREAALPITEDPGSKVVQDRREKEFKREELLKLAKEFLIYNTFSEKVLAGGKGVYEPTIDYDQYDSDIGTLQFERLMKWPEGFYLNGITHTFQYLAKTEQFLAIVDFNNLSESRPEKLQRFIEIISLSDLGEVKRRFPITHLDNDSLKVVVEQLSHHFRKVMQEKQAHLKH